MHRSLVSFLVLAGLLAPGVEAWAEDATRADPRAAVPVDASLPDAPRLERVPCRCGPCADPCAPRWRRWELSLEFGRSRFPSPSGPVGVPSADPNQFQWGTIRYGRPPAWRLGGRYALNRRDTLYLRAAWNGRVRVRGTDTGVVAFTPVPGGPVGFTTSTTATTISEVHSQTYELGWWRRLPACCPWRVEVGGALRVLHWHDMMLATGATPFAGMAGLPEIRSLGHNLFFGLQPGVNVERRLSRRLSAFTKAKAFAGAIIQELEVSDRDFFSAGPHTANRDRLTFAWGADFELGLRWMLNRCWSLSASYNLLFIDGVVRGYDAFDFSRAATGAVQSQFNESTLLLHFFYLGSVYRF